jgi:para-nitrobenzyl esterase
MPVPFMAGTVADEGTIFLRKMRSTDLAAYNAFFDKTLGPLAARAKPLYPAEDDATARRALADFIGDGFVSGARMAVRASASVQPKTFLYQFARMTRPMANSDLRCFHGAEIPYVFGNLPREKGYGDSDRQLSDLVMGCWVRFARSGDPNGDGAPAWPAYETSSDQHMILDLKPKMGSRLRQKTCDFFDAMQRR